MYGNISTNETAPNCVWMNRSIDDGALFFWSWGSETNSLTDGALFGQGAVARTMYGHARRPTKRRRMGATGHGVTYNVEVYGIHTTSRYGSALVVVSLLDVRPGMQQ